MRPKGATLSLVRNSLILALSIALVFATQTVQKRVRAGTVTDNINRYVDLFLERKDFKTECEEPEQPALFDPRDRVGRVINKYHDSINCLFNTRIHLMVAQMLKPEGEDDEPLSREQIEAMLENLSPPPPLPPDPETGESMGRKDCSNDGDGRNLSTYCLAKVATEEYFVFRRALVVARKQAKNEAAQNFPKDLTTRDGAIQQKTLLQAGKNIQEYGAVIEKINRELEISREALDQGLAAYQELQMALPLHRKYMEVIKKLEKYRDEVADIRDQVSLYPTVFLDVTTTQCN